MDFSNNKYLQDFDFSLDNLVSMEEIRRTEQEIGISFPKQYVDFMLYSNGGVGNIGESNLVIWEFEEVGEFYEACNIGTFPDVILFASDGGTMGFAFDKRQAHTPIVGVPLDSIDSDSVEFCANSFIEFLEYLYHYEWD